MSHGVGVRCLSVGRGNNRAVLEEVRPGMADVDEKGERRLGQVQSRGLEGQPDAQNARNAGASDVKAVQALNRNAHSGSAGGDQDVSLSIDYGNGLEASRKSGLTGKDIQQKAAEPQAGFRLDDRAKAKPGALVEEQSQTSTGTIIARQAEKNPALEPVKAYYNWAANKLEGAERETHQQLAREQLIALEPQTKGALDALDQRRQTQADQEDCGVHEVPKRLKESLQGQVSYPEKEIEGVRRLTPEDFKKLAMAMEVAGPAAEQSIKQTTQEILVRTGESSRDTMLAGINLVVGLLKYDRDLLVNPAKAREEAGKAGEGLALLLVAGVHVSFGAAGTIEQASQSGDYSLPLRHIGAALNSWYEKQSPADQMAIMAEIGGGFGIGAFTGEASRLRKPGAFTAFLREGLEALPKNPEAERKALDTLTRLFKGPEPLKQAAGLGKSVEKDYTFAMSKADDFEGLGKPGKGRPSRPVDERDIVNPIDRTATQEQKVAQLMALTEENKPLVEKFLTEVDTALGTKSEINAKEAKDILDKANRPSIKEKKDWFDVEHVRDSFRFKTPVENLNELPRIVEHLKNSPFEVVKLDLDKLVKPKGRGWRMAAIDLKAPNGQIIEYQILPRELNEAGKVEHQMYKKWRGKDFSSMTKAMRDAKDEADTVAADLYFDAWKAYLKRTGQTTESIKQIIKQTRGIVRE